jgi:adenosylcobinamide-GDP ribazoletransferase
MAAGLVAAVRMLTRIPVPGPETGPEHLRKGVGWFPLVGALVGAATAGVHALLLGRWPAPVAAVLAVAAGLLLTGGFHEDGFTDSADGLGGGWTRERVVEIMRDSRIGAYGAMALWLLLTFRWAALVALGPGALLALPLAMAWGRWTAAAMLAFLPPAAPGLGSQVAARPVRGPFVLATVLALAATAGAWALGRPRSALAAGAAALVALGWSAYLKRRLGGHTGDLLGAGNQLAETAVLLVLLAR